MTQDTNIQEQDAYPMVTSPTVSASIRRKIECTYDTPAFIGIKTSGAEPAVIDS
jgi:hypothetical protein